jgi:hypothetical protein
MSMRTLVVSFTVVACVAAVERPAVADGGIGAPPPSAGSPASDSNAQETRKIVDISLLGVGVVVAGVGAALALKYNHPLGGCDAQGVCAGWEDSRVPLGLAMVGAGVFMTAVGTVLWLQVPKTTARVAFGPSGAILRGTF